MTANKMRFAVIIDLNTESIDMIHLDNGNWIQRYYVENVYYDIDIFDSHDDIIEHIIHLWENNKQFEHIVPLLNDKSVRDSLQANELYHDEQEKHAIKHTLMDETYFTYPDDNKDNKKYLRHCKLYDIIDLIQDRYITYTFQNIDWDEVKQIPPLITIRNKN